MNLSMPGSVWSVLVACLMSLHVTAAGASDDVAVEDDYVRVPLPKGFKVVVADFYGPVFTDSRGRTLYQWPVGPQRVGNAGDPRGKSTCEDVKVTESAGFMSPYPGGFILPDLETRPTCVQDWPPVLAAAKSEPVGNWTLITRTDGTKQWAYDGFAVYTSALDKKPGDVHGGLARPNRVAGGDGGSHRIPIGPPSSVPPGVSVALVSTGRMLVESKTQLSLYYSDNDEPNKSNCTGECLNSWIPLEAPHATNRKTQGNWSIIERSPGVNQWTYKKRPLYKRAGDTSNHSLQGSDEPGWRNAYTQLAPKPPAEFTMQDSTGGVVLADSRGSTIYIYNCIEDAVDQLSCDNPYSTQTYRFAICGGGDPGRCVQTFPYVPAPAKPSTNSQIWSVITIDPQTGRIADKRHAGALQVWAYRGRPVYTFSRDKVPGDTNADGFGEFRGLRNGFKAFWLRDDFYGNAGR